MIPTHQIHNVLKAFSKNLVHNGSLRGEDAPGMTLYSETGETSADGKRLAVMEKITESIIDKISRMGVGEGHDLAMSLTNHNNSIKWQGLRLERGTRFAYKAIDGNGEKKTRVTVVGEPGF